jgi:hypothetical protein
MRIDPPLELSGVESQLAVWQGDVGQIAGARKSLHARRGHR